MGRKRKKRKVDNDVRLAAFEKQCVMIAEAVKYIQANHNELLSADDVARMCCMSKSAFLRLSNSGGAPASIKLDRLRRWRRLEILAWISKGCPNRGDKDVLPKLFVPKRSTPDSQKGQK